MWGCVLVPISWTTIQNCNSEDSDIALEKQKTNIENANVVTLISFCNNRVLIKSEAKGIQIL